MRINLVPTDICIAGALFAPKKTNKTDFQCSKLYDEFQAYLHNVTNKNQ